MCIRPGFGLHVALDVVKRQLNHTQYVGVDPSVRMLRLYRIWPYYCVVVTNRASEPLSRCSMKGHDVGQACEGGGLRHPE